LTLLSSLNGVKPEVPSLRLGTSMIYSSEGNIMILQTLLRSVVGKPETSQEAPASEVASRAMQVLNTDELREVVGGPEIQNQRVT
jgi:hypothetical protein